MNEMTSWLALLVIPFAIFLIVRVIKERRMEQRRANLEAQEMFERFVASRAEYARREAEEKEERRKDELFHRFQVALETSRIEAEKAKHAAEGLQFLGRIVRTIGKAPRRVILWENEDESPVRKDAPKESGKEVRH